jgi:hypothetical protein
MIPGPVIELLTAALHNGSHVDTGALFEKALGALDHGDTGPLLRAYTDIPRWFPSAPLFAGRDAQEDDIVLGVWTLEDAARTVLLARAADAMDAAHFATAAADCYEQGDTGEQQSWLRGLPLLPAPERFLSVAIDACRTNILPLFESIACENSYPARYFPERNFNQLVLKAMFNGISLVRIIGLPARRNAELTRMARDYADERRAAGRPIPPDIALAMTGDTAQEQSL